MSEAVNNQAGSRILNAAARLSQGEMLSALFTICETQKQISTNRLENHLEAVGDRLKDCAFEVRMGYDTLAARLAESERAAKNDAIAYRAVIEKQEELRRQLAESERRVAELEARQGGPVQICAVAVMRYDAEDRLSPEWLLEGGTAELMNGQVLLCADRNLTDEDGHCTLYTTPPAPPAVAGLMEALRNIAENSVSASSAEHARAALAAFEQGVE